ncbi:MAG: alpha/beta hydrolase [Pseudomonadota bacterium]|nr:alpha/beta hydrolase [Pseudomonadota bacterium]
MTRVDDAGAAPGTLGFTTSGGLNLAAQAWGAPDAPPVVLLHGGGQTRHSWRGTAAELARQGWYVLAIDQRGHGESDWVADGNYHFDHYVQDFREIAATLAASPVLVGASLGGLVGLLSQGERRGDFLRALVLVDIVPRIEPRGEGQVRNFMAGNPEGFASVEAAADAVARYLPHRRRPDDISGLKRNLRRRGGRYYWHWDSRMMRSFSSAESIHERLETAATRLDIPTLLIRGEISDVVSPQGAREFLRAVPHAEFVEVPGAGHMVAGDSNDIFTHAVVDFLSRLQNRDDAGPGNRNWYR